MKKILLTLFSFLIISFSFCLSIDAQTSGNENIQITLPTFKVTLSGVIIDSENSQYPLIIYNDITYFPMTYNDSRLLGIDSNFTHESGLAIVSGAIPITSSSYQPYISNTPNNSVYNASLPNFQIRVNGKIIDNSTEQYPLLLFRGITYFPLTWRFAYEEFGWNYSFDTVNGLVVNCNNNVVSTPTKVTYPNNQHITTSNPDIIYYKFASAKFPLHLYSDDGKTYLGKLTTNKYDADSISNTYGTYGSEYSRTSIFNEYGTYGSKYNSQSAFNEYASSPPKIYDSNGNFIAYLTANEYKLNGITYIKLMMYLEKFNQ